MKLEYGVCGGPEMAAAAATAGFDYFEWSVRKFLKPQESREVFLENLAAVKAAPLPCPVLNVFMPPELKITGPVVDMEEPRQYVATSMARAGEAGVEAIVFGSGGSRRIPNGFARDTAREQIVSFCRMLAPIALENGITVMAEPLNRKECNILTTVRETAELVREVGHPGLRMLVDGYHWLKGKDSEADLVDSGNLLHHAHIATVSARRAPGAEACDFSPFFKALHRANYTGRLSIEAKFEDPVAELPKALEVMKSLAAQAGQK